MLHAKRSIKEQDAAFEKLLYDIQFSARETELTPEKRRARRAEADKSALAFARIYYPQVFEHPWNDLHRRLTNLGPGKYSVSGFPMAGKSAFCYLGLMARHIALGLGGIAAICSRDLDTAAGHTKALSRVIQRNRLLVYDYELELLQDRAGYHIFKAQNGQTHLVAGSVNTGLRGIVDDEFNRIMIAVGDDLYNKETARSPTDNQRVFEWITGELHRQMEPDGICIVLGNAINDDCPVLKLREERPGHHFSFPIMDEAGESAWPEAYPKERIREMQKDIPFDVWEGEYMDTPAEKGDIFDPAWLREVHVNTTKIIASITAIDPSHGESPHACFKSAFTLGATSRQEVICLDVYLRRENYQRFFDYLDAVRERTAAHKVFLFENDFAQWGFAQPYYMQWMERRKKTLPIVMHKAKDLKTKYRAADKESRILNLVHPHQTGMFKYHREIAGSEDYQRYRKQFLAFGKSRQKLDGLDAAATAYIKIFSYIQTGTFKPLAKRQHERPHWAGGWH